jgi:hypothetical protein
MSRWSKMVMVMRAILPCPNSPPLRHVLEIDALAALGVNYCEQVTEHRVWLRLHIPCKKHQ